MATNQQSKLRSDQYRVALVTLNRRIATIAATAWSQVSAVDEPAEDAFVRTFVPFVLTAQASAVSVTDAYLATYLTAELGEMVPTKGLVPSALIGSAAHNGVSLDTVYRRPFGIVRAALAGGTEFAKAMHQGRARVVQAARTDIALAARAAGQAWMDGDKRVTGWRRTTSSSCCGLCAGAADGSVSRTEVVMPMHPGCNCFAEPVTVVERTKAPVSRPQPAITDGEAPRPIQVVDHGELGPVLYEAGHDFSDS